MILTELDRIYFEMITAMHLNDVNETLALLKNVKWNLILGSVQTF